MPSRSNAAIWPGLPNNDATVPRSLTGSQEYQFCPLESHFWYSPRSCLVAVLMSLSCQLAGIPERKTKQCQPKVLMSMWSLSDDLWTIWCAPMSPRTRWYSSWKLEQRQCKPQWNVDEVGAQGWTREGNNQLPGMLCQVNQVLPKTAVGQLASANNHRGPKKNRNK